MAEETPFKLTYATMFNPPEELHTRFEDALTHVKVNLGEEYSMLIDGKEKQAAETFEDHSPINTGMVLGIFQKGDAARCGCGSIRGKTGFSCLERLSLERSLDHAAESSGYH